MKLLKLILVQWIILQGIDFVKATLNGREVTNGQLISLANMSGLNTLIVKAMDKAGNTEEKSVDFIVNSEVDGKIKVLISNKDTNQYVKTINPFIMIKNNSDTDLDLSEIKVRYYFSADSGDTLNFWCDYASIVSAKVTGNFVRMDDYRADADCYLEIGFLEGSGKLAPKESIELHLRFAKSN
ncbi:MAG TPA: cellulose binding domain-containing protein [Pseudobacteroides sp.]|nr:cellulose binding domain-containing protein [Pseudobacteroides sp.]